MNHYTIFTILLVSTTSVVGQNTTTNNSITEGNNNSTKDGKIIGGYYTNIAKFPYQLQLLTNTGYCGGSILSKYWALSAGHCLKGVIKAIFRAGTSYWNSGGSLHYVQKICVHPNYNSRLINNDVAVARVIQPFVYGRYIAPVVIPIIEPYAGTPVTVSGWGSYSYYQGPTPTQLKALNEKIISRSTCNLYYSNSITSSMICASAPGNSACSGDSGGPLVYGRIQYGVVSWGDRCTTKRPDVYANVAALSRWIKLQTGL